MSTIRVLLIEDRDEMSHRIASLVRGARHPAFAIERATSSDEALTRIAERRHDVYLVGEGPGDGRLLDLLEAAHATGSTAPVILLIDTGSAQAPVPPASTATATPTVPTASTTASAAAGDSAGADAEPEISLPPGAADWVDARQLSAPLLRRTLRYAVERARGVGALKESEERLVQAQRMESLGRLVGGVAHDFNNLLTGILGYASILERETPRNQPSRRPVEEIRKAAELASTLTRQLLAYSRKQSSRRSALDINSVLDGLADMLTRLIGSHLQLEITAAPDLAPVLADPGQIEQIVLNLVLNARDASRPGGRISLSTGLTLVADADARREGIAHGGPFVRLSVQDTGEGMSPDVRAHLFEPFFTTKPIGKGTGLGLSSVQAIARQGGGFVQVTSAVGEGTTVAVHLPVALSSAARGDQGVAAAPDFRGTETVLVIEDDDTVRTFVKEALLFYGYRPLLAADPVSALRLARETTEPIAVALTDIVLPEMSGMHVAQQLIVSRPGLDVIFMSGYIDAKGSHVALPPDAHFLRKPFAPEDLARMLRAVLDRGIKAARASS
jgi:signal transduction histidine kinase/ActR/RegA family two-component response regulator